MADHESSSAPEGAEELDIHGGDGDYDDDDEDTWSRRVETDDIPRLPSSITGEATTCEEGEDRGSANGGGGGGVMVPPRREEPTLKEKLVERERQRRVETERARWKRQFAMAAHTEASDGDEDDPPEGGNGQGFSTLEPNNSASMPGQNHEAMRETNSVAGTVGEDTVAPVETLMEDDANAQMNYPMERFLRGMDTDNDQQLSSGKQKDPSREAASNQGVLMARFLQGGPTPTPQGQSDTAPQLPVPLLAEASSPDVNRSVSFDTVPTLVAGGSMAVELGSSGSTTQQVQVSALSGSLLNMSTTSSSLQEEEILDTARSNDLLLGLAASATGSVANASTLCMPPSEDEQEESPLEVPATGAASNVSLRGDNTAVDFSDIPPIEPTTVVDLATVQSHGDPLERQSPSQPRVVLRLTEAEIQEMAAIDEASRSNAPPSERDDISELGELVSDFGGPILMEVHGNPSMSQGTPTTEAMESASSIANHSGVVPGNMSTSDRAEEDQHSIDGMGNGSVTSQVGASSVGGDVSLAGNPPSDADREHEDDHEHLQVLAAVDNALLPPVPDEIRSPQPDQYPVSSTSTDIPMLDLPIPSSVGALSVDEQIVNRQIRPGVFNHSKDDNAKLSNTSRSPLRKAASFPDQMFNSQTEHIEDFDFDKNHPSNSPQDFVDDSMPRNEQWSSGLSPSRSGLQSHGTVDLSKVVPDLPAYGAVDHEMETQRGGNANHRRSDNSSAVGIYDTGDNDGERTPLLESGVPAIISARRGSAINSLTSIRRMSDVNSIAESVFSDIRSESTAAKNSISNDAELYLESSILHRAFPERLFALTVTLLFEIPVLLMVSGGSDRLCHLIGRTKYQLLMGFLPLSSAISGNVGLQSSTLTTRAISHGHVKVQNYAKWLGKEVGAATYLGVGMGSFLGLIAYVASGFSIPFGLTVMIAQFISILTAGITGTFAPLIFTFIFERDSGKWGGPLETAIQDIVGSFAMVVISYQILEWFGPFDISVDDTCGSDDVQ